MKKTLRKIIQEFIEKYSFKPNYIFLSPEHIAMLRDESGVDVGEDITIYLIRIKGEPNIIGFSAYPEELMK